MGIFARGRNSGMKSSFSLSLHRSTFKFMAHKEMWPCLWVTPPKLVEMEQILLDQLLQDANSPSSSAGTAGFQVLVSKYNLKFTASQYFTVFHCHLVFYWEISRKLAVSVATPGSSQIRRAKGFQIILLEGICWGCCSLHECPRRNFYLILTHFALKPYGQWNVTRKPWIVTQLLEKVEPSQWSMCRFFLPRL